ncbi:DUF1643 domain-containing protein [Apilactobacillus quenuiae]|uniref:DUF1643 domain-containing protein n=1 Tax=Apilactobacillus quenuiae TaxID=2008377 RepID=UPI001300120A|nr:DUF1643 domain-containing protein [Apilactobacillus quenuiae]
MVFSYKKYISSVCCNFDGDSMYSYRYYLRADTKANSFKSLFILMENPSIANSMYADPSVNYLSNLFHSDYKSIYIINTFAIIASSGVKYCLDSKRLLKNYNNNKNFSTIKSLFKNNKKSELLLATGKVENFNSLYYEEIIDEALNNSFHLSALADAVGNISNSNGFSYHPRFFITGYGKNNYCHAAYKVSIKIDKKNYYKIK